MNAHPPKPSPLDVRCDSPGELRRAIGIPGAAGFRISQRLRRPAACASWPQSACLLRLQPDRRSIVGCPCPRISGSTASGGVRLYTVPELEKIAESGFRRVPRWPVFHIPHDGQLFPAELMADVCIPEMEFMAYHQAMRDQDVRLMVPSACAGGARIAFPVSRLLCDVERFIGPEEVMERYGMGFCYEKAYDGRTIKRVTDRTRALARVYYDRHHREVSRLCARRSRVIFFDMHSYSDRILPSFAREPGRAAPDLCIGTDPRFTPPELTETVKARFEAEGFTTAENRPYSGLYVPEDVMSGRADCDFIGIMLEFNRRAYCDAAGNTLLERTGLIRSVIAEILEDCAGMGT